MPNVEIEEDEMRAADLMSTFISTLSSKKMTKAQKIQEIKINIQKIKIISNNA